ncbi:MAG: type I-E CRISPR-associated protein Cas5/CasD [Bacteroidetes bacterium QS_7_67_15]|nr:MAG: type I-E CRISPR-associated protein Cas5/CasD [Bacteroidetes bacterium QS_7_67_15]
MSNDFDILVLRLDAPLMSFGAPVVDQQGKIQAFPAQSLVTGLLANALGFDRSEHERLASLQRRLAYAVRQDRAGQKITDYQTVDLTPAHMSSYVWTKAGRKQRRTGKDREILHRDYWADAIYTVALTLDPPDEAPPFMDDVEAALKRPERPLFIGRKTCLPAASLFVNRTRREARSLADGLVAALADPDAAPLAERANQPAGQRYPMWWPLAAGSERRPEEERRQSYTDQRDWQNQIHVGERWVAQGKIELNTAASDE